jgi:formate hydrogenlyase subunit 6/NADH:ubiquinone oxidoreductase subunit I
MCHFVRDIYYGLKTFLAGMKVTGVYLKDSNLKPNQTTTTVPYDGKLSTQEGVSVADRFRGHLHGDVKLCTGCKLCMRACPIDCIWIEGERTETNKQRISRFDIDFLRCMHCGLCVAVCPTGCLRMTKEWWGSTKGGCDGTSFHGLLHHDGVGFFTPEEKLEVERKRVEAAEAKKKAAAEAAAKKKAEDEAKAAATKQQPPAETPAADQKPGPAA